MKNTFGSSLAVTLFGESHLEAVGAVLDGLCPGLPVSKDVIDAYLSRRRPSGNISTARSETDEFKIVSGVYNGKTTGTPLCIVIPNSDVHSTDYTKNENLARPGHADYSGFVKYSGFNDPRGGGHFSGRITAALVAAGAVIMPALEHKGIRIGSHILNLAGISDRPFSDYTADFDLLYGKSFPVLDDAVAEKMQKAILDAKENSDSVGGVLDIAVTGIPAGVGEPWFDSVESLLSHAMFSIPAVKGVEFGAGFDCAALTGSKMNDAIRTDGDKIYTATNNNGGINGGITNGMPIVMRCAVKPTPSIAKAQQTVNYVNNTEAQISVTGRHDPCIVHRAAVVAECLTALTVADLLLQHFGTDWLRKQ